MQTAETKSKGDGSDGSGMRGIRKLTMRLPGSTTNLGPGFDTLGLALGVYTTVIFEIAPEDDDTSSEAKALRERPLISLKGTVTETLSVGTDNLIYKVFRDNSPAPAGGPGKSLLDRVRITIDSEIPLARGLGSSSTAILAALWAAQSFSSTASPDKEQILARAAKLEGHPDNVAACLMGGFVISGYRQKGSRAITSRVTWPEKWRTLVVVPPYELSTAEARRVLPRRVGMAQAVNNVQRTGLLIGAVVNGDDEILRESLSDQLHEPFRQPLVPELEALRHDLANLPILGCTLSGAGPSCLVLVNEKHKEEVKSHLNDWAQKRRHKPQILDLAIDKKGLVATYE